jgi:3-phosphoshikimate 1-carboxyvinyltransferase
MTAALMKSFGVNCSLYLDKVVIEPQTYKPCELTVESDWSAASYWLAFTALAGEAEVLLPNLTLQSLQGDYVIVEIMYHLGVDVKRHGEYLHLTKKDRKKEVHWDFTHCPDLAQTVCVVCAATGTHGIFTGLESLRIKETDRITALQKELGKIGAGLKEDGSRWILEPSITVPKTASFQTYKDHRMAMAFAPLATRMDVTIENPGVVKKSYPKFWEDIKAFGFEMNALS